MKFLVQDGAGISVTVSRARRRRRNAVEFLECFCKAVRTLITVFYRGIKHLDVTCGKLRTGERQSTATNIFPHRETAEYTECTLKMIA